MISLLPKSMDFETSDPTADLEIIREKVDHIAQLSNMH